MAIRTLAAAAALFAFATTASAQENAAVVADSLASLADSVKLGGFAVGATPIIISGALAAIVYIAEDGTATIDTDV